MAKIQYSRVREYVYVCGFYFSTIGSAECVRRPHKNYILERGSVRKLFGRIPFKLKREDLYCVRFPVPAHASYYIGTLDFIPQFSTRFLRLHVLYITRL